MRPRVADEHTYNIILHKVGEKCSMGFSLFAAASLFIPSDRKVI